MEYDLENRTLVFSKNVIHFIKKQKRDYLNQNILSQLIRSATNVGANYHEANGASSKKDFKNKIYFYKKEIKETKYWIELLGELLDEKDKEELRNLYKEANELTLIFNKISSTLNNKNS